VIGWRQNKGGDRAVVRRWSAALDYNILVRHRCVESEEGLSVLFAYFYCFLQNANASIHRMKENFTVKLKGICLF